MRIGAVRTGYWICPYSNGDSCDVPVLVSWYDAPKESEIRDIGCTSFRTSLSGPVICMVKWVETPSMAAQKKACILIAHSAALTESLFWLPSEPW